MVLRDVGFYEDPIRDINSYTGMKNVDVLIFRYTKPNNWNPLKIIITLQEYLISIKLDISNFFSPS